MDAGETTKPPDERLPVWLEAILIFAGFALVMIVLAYFAKRWAQDHWAILLLAFLCILGALGFSYQLHRQHQELLGALQTIPFSTACYVNRAQGIEPAGCEELP